MSNMCFVLFANSSCLLRDCLIQSISNSETQRKLLTDPELTFQRAVVGMGHGSSISINKIHSKANSNKNGYGKLIKFPFNNKYNAISNLVQSQPSSPGVPNFVLLGAPLSLTLTSVAPHVHLKFR